MKIFELEPLPLCPVHPNGRPEGMNIASCNLCWTRFYIMDIESGPILKRLNCRIRDYHELVDKYESEVTRDIL